MMEILYTQHINTMYTCLQTKIHLKIKKNEMYQVQFTHIVMFLFVKG